MKRGRKTVYDKDKIIPKIIEYCKMGLTEAQMASNLGIVMSTLSCWKLKYKEISETLKAGKEEIDIQVENALFKRATGFETEETTTIAKNSSNSQTTEIHKTKKLIPPDPTSMIFWLKNRQPKKWTDRKEITGANGESLRQVFMIGDKEIEI